LIANIRTSPLKSERISKSIAVRTDSESLPRVYLRFSLEVRAPIIFQPGNRLVISTVEGQEKKKRVLLRRTDGEALEILSAETGEQKLVVTTEPVVEKEMTNDYEAAPGDVWLELALPADAPIGHRRGNLRLSTNDPVAKSFDLPLVMRVRPLIEHRPDGVRLWTTPSRTGDGYSGFVTLSKNGEGVFSITGIDVSHPEFLSAVVVSSEAAKRQTVRVELVEGLAPEDVSSTIEGWIEITTDDPIRSKVDVPVLVASSRESSRRPFPSQRRN
jgi:hypothetical protein